MKQKLLKLKMDFLVNRNPQVVQSFQNPETINQIQSKKTHLMTKIT